MWVMKKVKYREEFTDVNGAAVTLHYDVNHRKQFVGINNSPVRVEFKYPKGYKSPEQRLNESQKDLNPTQRQYFHPETGDKIGYTRYMNFVKEGTAPHPEEI
jgi:hypothetical protein